MFFCGLHSISCMVVLDSFPCFYCCLNFPANLVASLFVLWVIAALNGACLLESHLDETITNVPVKMLLRSVYRIGFWMKMSLAESHPFSFGFIHHVFSLRISSAWFHWLLYLCFMLFWLILCELNCQRRSLVKGGKVRKLILLCWTMRKKGKVMGQPWMVQLVVL